MDADRKAAKEAVKNMPRGQRIKYYIGYYKIHALVTVVLLIAVALFIRTMLTHQTSVMYFGTMNSERIDEQYLNTAMKEVLGLGEKEKITVHKDLSSLPVYGEQDKVSLYLAVDQLNVVFSDEEGVKFMVDSEACLQMKYWCDMENYPKWKDRVYSYNGYDVAIDISGLPIMEKLVLEDDIKYILVTAKAGNEEYIKLFLDWVYEME